MHSPFQRLSIVLININSDVGWLRARAVEWCAHVAEIHRIPVVIDPSWLLWLRWIFFVVDPLMRRYGEMVEAGGGDAAINQIGKMSV